MEILAVRLRSLRKEQHLRQSDVAEALKTALITYQRYEAGERDPNAPMIVAMADFYGVSADYLLGRRDERLSGPKLSACGRTGMEDAILRRHRFLPKESGGKEGPKRGISIFPLFGISPFKNDQ